MHIPWFLNTLKLFITQNEFIVIAILYHLINMKKNISNQTHILLELKI